MREENQVIYLLRRRCFINLKYQVYELVLDVSRSLTLNWGFGMFYKMVNTKELICYERCSKMLIQVAGFLDIIRGYTYQIKYMYFKSDGL